VQLTTDRIPDWASAVEGQLQGPITQLDFLSIQNVLIAIQGGDFDADLQTRLDAIQAKLVTMKVEDCLQQRPTTPSGPIPQLVPGDR
jgi:hypothetical protein